MFNLASRMYDVQTVRVRSIVDSQIVSDLMTTDVTH